MRSKVSAVTAVALGLVSASAVAQAPEPGEAGPPVTTEAAPAAGEGSDGATAAPAGDKTPEDEADASEDDGFPPVPPPLPDVFDEEEGGDPLVGFYGGRVYLRDAHDDFRLYPGGRMRADFGSSFGPGVSDVSEADGEAGLAPSFALRRVRIELSGELWRRLAFTLGLELGGERVGDAQDDDLGDRFSYPRATSGRIRPAEVSVSYRFRPWLNITVGQANVAFSMQNRTREELLSMMERSLGIRAFAVPYDKELGATVWGELPLKVVGYEYGVYNGDGPARPGADLRADFTGRMYARPLAFSGKSTFQRYFQVGLSARYGERQQEHVAYEYPAIATQRGFVMWLPRYVDRLGRTTHVIPSGAQRAIGGELRMPFDLPGGLGIDIRGEAYAVANNTREAVAGFEKTNTERLGRVFGVGWYAEVDLWLCGDPFVDGEPGIWRPPSVDLSKDGDSKRGLEVVVTTSGINGDYASAAREGEADPREPDASLDSYEFGGALQYWYGRNFRAALSYLLYHAPGSGDPSASRMVLPGNLALDEVGAPVATHVSHELAARVGVTF